MRQVTDTVLMIRPASFGSNPETVASNSFQDAEATARPGVALREFDAVVAALRAVGVHVCVVDDSPDPRRPDAVFPNNWITTHEHGTVVLFPMMAPSRRTEVRRDVVDALVSRFSFRVERVVDFTGHAAHGRFLEGTGSMVLDRVNRIAYACVSPRTDASVLDEFCATLGYRPFLFNATDASGIPIYHTNVMMWIGTSVVGVCLESVTERDALQASFKSSGRVLLELDRDQMASFAGNALALRGGDGKDIIAMSTTAWSSLTPVQRTLLSASARVVTTDIGTIERCSGGSVRCMLAEIFLPR